MMLSLSSIAEYNGQEKRYAFQRQSVTMVVYEMPLNQHQCRNCGSKTFREILKPHISWGKSSLCLECHSIYALV